MKKVIYLVAILLVSAATLFAQSDHKHGSPHGGEVKSAGSSHHLEAVVKGNILTVYLLDANEKTLNISGTTGTATIQTTDGKISKVPLKPVGKTSFTYKLDPAIKYNKAIVSMVTGGKTASASFDLNKKAPTTTHKTAKKAHTH